MSTRLLNVVAVPVLAPAASAVVAHGLNINGTGIQPDLAAVIGASGIGITATGTTITATNNGAVATSPFQVFVWHLHTIERVLGGAPDLASQPVVLGESGGAGSVETCNCPGDGVGSTRVGAGAFTPGATSTGVGISSAAIGDNSTVTGNGAYGADTQTSAYGQGALAQLNGATALASTAHALGVGATAVGFNARGLADDAVAVGNNCQANAPRAVSVGANVNNDSPDAVSIGAGANVAAASDRSVAIGPSSTAGGPDAVAIGSQAQGGQNTTVIGANSFVNGGALGGGVAVGRSLAVGANQVRIGSGTGTGLIDDFGVEGLGGLLLQAVAASVDIVPAGGAVGLLVSVDRGGAVAVEQVFCGPAASGPGGVGRALYIAD